MIVVALASATMRETLRTKVLYGAVFFAVSIFIAASLFGSVSLGDNVKVVMDFGLFSISLMAVVYTIIAGATLLHKELSQKTIYNVMSKPIHRWQFILGKFFGLVGVASVLVILMGIILTAYLLIWDSHLQWHLWSAYGFILLELVVVAALVIFFSSLVVTPFLNGMFAFGLFVVGRCSEYLVTMAHESGLTLLEYLYPLVPHLHQLWIGEQVVFGMVPEFSFVLWSILYVVAYSSVLLILAVVAFEFREFN